MPWDNQAFYPFTRESIQMYAPAGCGVYGLLNRDRWICIGQSGNLQAALLGHLGQPSQCISRWGPTMFCVETLRPAQCMSRQATLILELHPACPAGPVKHSPSTPEPTPPVTPGRQQRRG